WSARAPAPREGEPLGRACLWRVESRVVAAVAVPPGRPLHAVAALAAGQRRLAEKATRSGQRLDVTPRFPRAGRTLVSRVVEGNGPIAPGMPGAIFFGPGHARDYRCLRLVLAEGRLRHLQVLAQGRQGFLGEVAHGRILAVLGLRLEHGDGLLVVLDLVAQERLVKLSALHALEVLHHLVLFVIEGLRPLEPAASGDL